MTLGLHAHLALKPVVSMSGVPEFGVPESGFLGLDSLSLGSLRLGFLNLGSAQFCGKPKAQAQGLGILRTASGPGHCSPLGCFKSPRWDLAPTPHSQTLKWKLLVGLNWCQF